MRRNVSHRTMMSSIISLLLELRSALKDVENEDLHREFQEFENAATQYLRGQL